MKKILFFLCFLSAMAIEINAQTNSSNTVVVSNSHAVSTNLTDARYEFIQSSANSTLAFLVDKYTGKVWKYRIMKKEFEEIFRVNADSVDTTKVNYQLYMSGENASMCFLLNIHTGEMWRYSTGYGERVFSKMNMPWNK